MTHEVIDHIGKYDPLYIHMFHFWQRFMGGDEEEYDCDIASRELFKFVVKKFLVSCENDNIYFKRISQINMLNNIFFDDFLEIFNRYESYLGPNAINIIKLEMKDMLDRFENIILVKLNNSITFIGA